jgi:mono/diheme cytochrome c family protein
VLAGIDKGLALISWIAAAAVAVLLVIGPRIVAHDSAKQATAAGSPYASSSAAPDGKALFKSNCGSCHTLTAAGTSGQVGPNLTHSGLDQKSVEAMMQAGPGVMPSFTNSLTPAEFKAVAKFVAGS